MREEFKIVTNRIVRDERTERRIIEMQRERIFLGLMLAGALMILYVLVW